MDRNESSKFTVYDAVLLGREPYIKMNPTAEDHRITKDIIDRMGLNSFSFRNVDELSGGGAETVNCETIRDVCGMDVTIENIRGYPTASLWVIRLKILQTKTYRGQLCRLS